MWEADEGEHRNQRDVVVLNGMLSSLPPSTKPAAVGDRVLMAHRAGQYATLMMVGGGLITSFTVLSAFTATRIYLSEQFPTELRGRGHIFGESFSRLFAGVLAPFLMEPHLGSPMIFFATILVVVAIGAFIPLLFGRETVGRLETGPIARRRRKARRWRGQLPDPLLTEVASVA
jgi:hypothetical protein